jgi:hypothetical protein
MCQTGNVQGEGNGEMKFDFREDFLVSTALFLCPEYSANTKYSILHNFTGGSNDGEKPDTPPLVPPDLELYGVTYDEAAAADGTIFKINIAILASEWLDCGLEPPSACNQ